VKLSIYILTTIGLLFSGSLKAQFPTNLPQQGGTGFPTGNQQTGFPQPVQKDKNKQNPDGRIGLDDSTKVIYGPTSTKYFLEEDVFNNRKRLYNIDTTMDGIHNYNFVQRNKNLYTDLGNMGTAIRPIFYKAPEQIGTLLGYDAFSLYTFKPAQVRYFNTKSPFSNIIYVPGGNDQDLLQFELSRNIDSLWNVGINVQRISSNKQLIDRTATADNTAISHWDFMVHSNYQTVNKKYSLLAYFNLSDHNSNDQGGVVVETGRDLQYMLQLSGNRPILTNASTRDKSYNLHVYHEYAGYKAFQVYQVIDFQTRKVQFKDANFSDGWKSRFYPYAFSSTSSLKGIRYPADTTTSKTLILDSLYNESNYTNFEYKTGIKGFYNGFNYRLHFRQRFFSYSNPLNREYPKIDKNDNFLGLWLNQYFKDSTRFFGEVEYLLGKKDIKVNGEFQGKWLNVGGSYISSSPTFVQQYTFNNGFRWNNPNTSLVNVVTLNAFGYTNLKIKNLTLRPSIDVNKISDYIYYDSLSTVKQNISTDIKNNDIYIVRAGLGLDFRKGKFSTTNQIFITPTSITNSKEEELKQIIRIPPIFINTRLAYELLYKKKLYIQTGVELHYKSGYYADAYMPALQQFHLQNKQEILGYLQADVFADMRINRVRLFLKFAHVNQGLFTGGYYASPGFAGMGRTFEFGVHWLLFD
jgi:Putative porin